MRRRELQRHRGTEENTEKSTSITPCLRVSVVTFLHGRPWAIAELAILLLFLASILVAIAVPPLYKGGLGGILERNTAVSTDMEDSESAEEYVRRGDRIYAAGRSKFDEASIQYWEAIRRDPAAADAHFKLATIYYEYIWNHEVLRELGEVERIDPNYPGLYLLLGKVYHRIGDADRASEAFQRAVTLQPGSSEAHYYMGTVYEQRNMRQEAISEYEKAVETGSDDTAVLKAHLQLGRIYKKERKREKAEDELREALSIDPASAEVISELRGLYRQEAEDYEYRDEHGKAAEKYEGILEIDPDNPRNVEIYMKLGNIYRSDELYDKAAAMYEAATKLDPLNYDVFSALKELELLRNNDSEKE